MIPLLRIQIGIRKQNYFMFNSRQIMSQEAPREGWVEVWLYSFLAMALDNWSTILLKSPLPLCFSDLAKYNSSKFLNTNHH